MNEWYCRHINGIMIGPKTFDQIQEMTRVRQISPFDLIRQGVNGPWKYASEVAGLVGSGNNGEVPAESMAKDLISLPVPPPLPAKMTGPTMWWAMEGDCIIGPLEESEVLSRVADERLPKDTQACIAGAREWRRIAEWPQLAAGRPVAHGRDTSVVASDIGAKKTTSWETSNVESPVPPAIQKTVASSYGAKSNAYGLICIAVSWLSFQGWLPIPTRLAGIAAFAGMVLLFQSSIYDAVRAAQNEHK
jgi:hypothetical protein